MNHPPLPDPLDDFLQHPPALAVDLECQASLYEKSAALLRKPARQGWPVVVGLAASIVLAMIAAYFFFGSKQVEPAPPNREFVEQKPEPVTPNPKPEEPKIELVRAVLSPRELEWKAFDAQQDAERVRLYFQAGDLFLSAHQDVDSALRCYQQAILYCEERGLELDENDNWLVMALKRDHRKEK